jgi:hypothetical protein
MPPPPRFEITRLWLTALLLIVSSALSPATLFAQAAVSPAAMIAGQLATPGFTITSVSDYTALTDPDGLLGAPGQYIARAGFIDSTGVVGLTGVTGDVEVFASARDAKTRLNGLAAGAAGQELDIPLNLVILRLYNPRADVGAYKLALSLAVGAPL